MGEDIVDSESISSQKEGASEESLSATPKKKNKKLIWALIVALFLLVTVVEGAICVHLFMPKVKEKEEDKLLVGWNMEALFHLLR